MVTWDPQRYLQFGDERTRAAQDLLARVPERPVQRVYDLGCGPGNSTALIAARWPAAQVIGVDSDPAMLTKAAESGLLCQWENADLVKWCPSAEPDVLYSNAALQWINGHETLLPRLIEQLPQGGVLAVQMPTNHSAPSHRIMHDLAHQADWSRDLTPVLREDPVLRPDAYSRILSPHCRALDMWETTYWMRLRGENAVLNWIKGSALRPLLAALDPERARRFESLVAEGLAEAYPISSDGITLFPFRRLFFVAVR